LNRTPTAPAILRTALPFRSRLLSFATALVAAVLLLACSGGDDSPGMDEHSPLPDVPRSPVASGGAAASCSGGQLASITRTNERNYRNPPERVIDPNKSYTAVMKTVKGDITLDLAAKDAPNTVNNFVFLSCVGYYDTLNFHRFEPGFVIQGGDPRGNGTGGPGYLFGDEFSPNQRHSGPGILSMANAGPGTNGSQFFITLAAAPHLNDKHSVFGKVTAGMEVVNQIRAGDKIISVSVQEK
jgi:peptidyl-prolyl cis-trans isomerase B (cyclophilin B)